MGITEKDMEEEQIQAFGLAKIQEEELRYIDIETLIIHGVELDLHWTPKSLDAIQGKKMSSKTKIPKIRTN
ncbi:hypothetical protein [Nitrosomonas sp. Nm34]|uniref:hypothetical protein n=1 Tax=Nitrosomonas sp. Nm34 TaxID=1881055 RepID=UPI0008E9FA2F|nr:hypothetical protein [Nitrosomonas sp. Nm34]SFI97845.1 hypothetical protein SAMN05428978_107212 [Nitrosomonas sp. Nm34]